MPASTPPPDRDPPPPRTVRPGEPLEPKAGDLFRHEPPTNTKERLIAAALNRFYAFGFHAVGLDQICADVGISKQAFYRHFPSKEDLAVEVIRRRDAQEASAFVEMIDERAKTARDKLYAIFTVLDEWFTHPDYEGCLFLTACNEFPNPNDPIHQAASCHYAQSEEWLAALAKEAGADDPRTLAREITVLIEGALAYRLVAHDNTAARLAATLARELLDRRLPNAHA